jgi:hypothetical protein
MANQSRARLLRVMAPEKRPAWRAMFARMDAKRKVDRIAETRRRSGLSHAKRWGEMADTVRRWGPRMGISGLARKCAEDVRQHVEDPPR